MYYATKTGGYISSIQSSDWKDPLWKYGIISIGVSDLGRVGFAMHYWLHLSNSSMLDCIRFERSFSPFETKSETLVSIIQDAYRAALFIPHHKLRGANQLLLSPLSTRSSLRRPTPPCYIACPYGLGRGRMARVWRMRHVEPPYCNM